MFFVYISVVFPVFFLILDPRGRQRGLAGKVRSAREKFEDSEAGIFGF